jgi:ABC-type sugar transport system substrate-binding protein
MVPAFARPFVGHSNSRRLAAAVAVCLIVASCGGDDDAASSVTDSSEAPIASSDGSIVDGDGEMTVEAPPTEPPTEIGVTIPLVAAPEPGVRVAWLACELPSCGFFTEGFQAATDALGWELEVISFPSATPGQAVQQAVQAGVDYIAITGSPRALYEQELQAAHAAGIPVISCNATDPPDPEAGLVTQCGDATMFRQQALYLSRWMIKDSGQSARVALVNLRDYPILVEGEHQMAETFAAECPDCSLDVLPITVEDIGSGGVPQLVASYLQSNPDTDYVAFTFSDPLLGVPEALAAAGLADGVGLTGLALSDVSIAGLVDGTVRAWVAQPIDYQSWLMVDAMARLSVGMELDEERQSANLPTWVVDSPEVAKTLVDSGLWPGPADYQNQFKALWGIT